MMTGAEEDGGDRGAPAAVGGGKRNVAVGGAGLFLLMRMYHIVYQRLAMVFSEGGEGPRSLTTLEGTVPRLRIRRNNPTLSAAGYGIQCWVFRSEELFSSIMRCRMDNWGGLKNSG